MTDTINVVSPLDGRILESMSMTSSSAIDEAVGRAQKAQKPWKALGIKKRSQILYRYHDLLVKTAKDFVEIIHEENGKTLDEAKAEVEKAIEVTEFACSMPQFMLSESLEVSSGVDCTMRYEPLGVVASITPCNFPIMIPNWTMPIALMAGNAMLLKPSDLVPLSAIKMANIAYEAGVPEDIFQIILGNRHAVATLCEHPDVSAISFVGSTPVAKQVYRQATSHYKRALCLGGANNHLLVLPDADLNMTSSNIVASMSGMAGQRCMAASIMVAIGNVDPIIDRVVTLAQGVVPGKNMGAIVSKQAKERIEQYIASAQEQGAQIKLDGRGATVPGKKNGFYIGPTIIDGVTPDMKVAQDEVFGPVLSILRCNSVDEAIAIQNSSPYGNGASLYTNSGGMAKYISERLTAGMLGVNIGVPVPREPFSFGGVKESKFGVGDITGKSSINFWTTLIKQTTKWNEAAGTNWMS